VTSDENLNYATQNRKEWEERGREVIAEMMQNIQKEELEGEREIIQSGGRDPTSMWIEITI
jgi:hypothetical protein